MTTVEEQLKEASQEISQSWDVWLADKRQANISGYEDRCTILQRAQKNPDNSVQVILNNYGFNVNHRFRRTMVPEISLPPAWQQLAILNGEYRYQHGNFRDPNWVKTGCLGEMGFIYLMNCVFHFFQLETQLPWTDTQTLLYSGDGGNDFRVGNSLLDIKYRDDNPAKGMALQDKFLRSSLREAECLLVQTSNTTSDRKLGHSVVNTPLSDIVKDLPLAMVGWVSVREYDRRKEPFEGFSDWIVDDLEPFSKLVIRLVGEVNEQEGLFEV